jgi:putative glutamine amidotransferase
VEIHLIQQALQARQPFMGICRGLQVINVALGGSLYEDILDQRSGALRHAYGDLQPRNYLAHTVQLEESSLLASYLGASELQVNSLHHQGIRRLADGLKAAAIAPDGLVEAFEMPGYPFALAVQWHPEALQEHTSMQRLFQAFVKACQMRNDRDES